jgi:hypothetical protein
MYVEDSISRLPPHPVRRTDSAHTAAAGGSAALPQRPYEKTQMGAKYEQTPSGGKKPLTLADIEVPATQLTIGEELGSGEFGVCMRGVGLTL